MMLKCMKHQSEAYVMLSPAVTVYPIPVPTRFKYWMNPQNQT